MRPLLPIKAGGKGHVLAIAIENAETKGKRQWWLAKRRWYSGIFGYVLAI